MKKSMLFNLILANNPELLKLALKLEEGMELPFKKGELVYARVTDKHLPEGKMFRDYHRWGYMPVVIQEVNKYKLRCNYLINGEWLSGDSITREYTNDVVDVPLADPNPTSTL